MHNSKILFVLGRVRLETTLLISMLNSYNQISVAREGMLIMNLIKNKNETTYQKAATLFVLSRQKVLNTIRELEKIEQPKTKRTDKKKVEYLYIEADEDHVSLQKGGTSCPKKYNIHKGFQEVIGEDKRHKLKNARDIAGEYKCFWYIWKEA